MDSITQDMLIDIHSKTEIYLPDIYDEILHISHTLDAIFIMILVLFVFIVFTLLLVLLIFIRLQEDKEEQNEQSREKSGYNNKGA